MRILCLALILSLSFISCKKEDKNTPSNAQTVTGILRYYSSTAGYVKDKLRYETDGTETLLFYDADSYDYYQYQKYQTSVDIHSTLTYEDTGETGCSLGLQATPCTYPLRVVKVIKLVIDK
jgi:hypothetical protein